MAGQAGSANKGTPKSQMLTRGGWAPVGTAAERRATHTTNGTERGRRTRQKLVDAARRTFERVGFFDASVDDIVAEAQVARGSFYTYFPDKLHIFREVAAQVGQAIREAVAVSHADHGDVVRRLEQSNRQYIVAYRLHAAM